MAFQAGAITGEIGLDAEPQTKAIKTAIAGAKEYRQEMEKAAKGGAAAMKKGAEEGESSAKKMVEGIKQSLGKRSALGEWTELLAGGGAIMGLSLVAEKASEGVKKLGELNEQMRQGKANAFDMAEGVAKMVPVFGQFYELGRSIRDLFTGEKASMEENTQVVNDQNAALAKRAQIIKDAVNAEKDMAEALRHSANALALAGMKPGDDKDKASLQFKTDDSLAGLRDKYSKDAKLDDIAALQKQKKDLAGKTDDESIRKSQNIDSQLQPLLESQKKLYSDYAKARNNIMAESAIELKEINGRPLDRENERIKKMQDEWNKARGELAKPLIDKKKETDQMGMTESQKILDNLKRAKAEHPTIISAKELADAKAVLDAFDKATKNKEMDERVKAIKEAIETPTEKLNKALAELKLEHDAGKLNDSEYARAQAKARTDNQGEHKGLGLIRSGSAESQAARFDGAMKNHPTSERAKSIAAMIKLTQALEKNTRHHQSQEPTSNLSGVG